MTVRIKKRSRVPGVMITQYVEELPEGMTTPDFTRKPIALTIQEGKVKLYLYKQSNFLLIFNVNSTFLLPFPQENWLSLEQSLPANQHQL